MVNQNALVQPIVVHRSGTHEDAVHAAALASVTAFMKHRDDPNWGPWLDSSFTKTVRRAKTHTLFTTAVASAACAVQTLNQASAAAFAPVQYHQMPRQVRKLQVADLCLPLSQWPTPDTTAGPVLTVNEDLGMSTGKTAAQAAHALFSWFVSLTPVEQSNWFYSGRAFTVTGQPAAPFQKTLDDAKVIIRDAGHTEIPAGSATVVVTT